MTGIIITDEERKRIAASRLRHKSQPPRLVHDCQGEQQPYRARLMDQLNTMKAGFASGFTAAEIRRFECHRSIAIIKREADALVLFETPTFAADALRKLADEIEGSDAA